MKKDMEEEARKMNENLKRRSRRYVARYKARKKLASIVLVLSIIVSLGVTMLMRDNLSALTLTCGMEEHIHTDSCYEVVCGMEEHEHGDDCFDEDGFLICELEEHVHDETCKELVCGMKEHVHESSCYGGDEDEVTQVFASTGDVAVTLTYDNAEDADRLSSIGLTEISEYDMQYDTLMEKTQEIIGDEQTTVYARFFEITPMDDGYVKGEPEGTTNVVLSLNDYLNIDENTEVKVVHIPDNEQAVEVDAFVEDKDELTVTFDTDSFSVFGVIYTVDLAHVNNGKTFEYDFPGGSVVSFNDLMPVLGIENLNISDISNIVFSNESLVKPIKIEQDITVADLKAQYGLTAQYSAELTEEEINEINAKTLHALDWALVSLMPFYSKEELTVTLNNGDVFTIEVTDDQVMSTSEIDGTGVNGYVIYVEVDGVVYVLGTDGITYKLEDKSELATVGNEMKWKFTYVYTEKNVTPNLDYYNIRPYNNNLVSMDVSWEKFDGINVKSGANNVYMRPYDSQGGFEIGGYNNARIACYDNGFMYSNMNGGRTRVYIYKESAAEYTFTVDTADAKMGRVEGYLRDGTAVSTAGDDNHPAGSFETVTNSSLNNKSEIKAVPISDKFIFDYWSLNGSKIDGLTATISENQLAIPKTGSTLVANFKVNPNYTENDKRGRTPKDINLDDWIDSILAKQKPLVDTGCTKTAEVYDYENRIYRVDLKAQSQMSTFLGTIDLGFVIDVSGSMKFPSRLVNLEKAATISDPNDPDFVRDIYGDAINFDTYSRKNSKGETEVDLTKINDNVNGKTRGETWGLKKNKEYFVLLDYGELPGREESPTGTVCYLYHNGSQWVLCDSSKDKGSDDFSVTDNSKKAYYKPNSNSYYVIKVAGDLVTNEEWNDPATQALMKKTNVRAERYKTRAYYLEKSINEAIATLDEIVERLSVSSNVNDDRKVKIAWNTFCNWLPSDDQSTYDNNGNPTLIKKSNQNQFITINQDETPIELIYSYAGGTSTDVALLDAAGYTIKGTDGSIIDKHNSSSTSLDKWGRDGEAQVVEDKNGAFVWDADSTRFVILITDGMPQRRSNGVSRARTLQAANYIKDYAKATLVSVGLSMADLAPGSALMYDISSRDDYGDPYYYEASNGGDLSKILYEIIQTLIVPATSVGNITDTVNEAFYPIDVNTGEALKVDDWITLDGQRISEEAKETYKSEKKPYGVISMENGLYVVKWESQDITWVNEQTNGWHGTVYVKAKERFIGGNAVRTNNEYTLEDGTVVNGASIEVTHIKGVDDTEERPLNEKYVSEGTMTNQTPRVNVNELDLVGVETNWTVYDGTQVSPYEQLKNMMNNIHAKEVVTSEENDQAAGGKSTYVYPIEANSISDDREGNAQGEKVTFSLSDELIRLYQEHNPGVTPGTELESLLDEAINSSSGKVKMPYDLYGQEDKTCGTIKVSIKELEDSYDLISELNEKINELSGNGDPNGQIPELNEHVKLLENFVELIRTNLSKDGHQADLEKTHVDVDKVSELSGLYEAISSLESDISDLIKNGAPEEDIQERRNQIATYEERINYLWEHIRSDEESTETYTLIVKFSPNYDAVPVGQGGDPALKMDEKFHTGSDGTGYQGHAAGTDESANIHHITPYKKKIQVIKTDEGGVHGNALKGAIFTLYSKKTDEDASVVEKYDMGDETSIVIYAPNDSDSMSYYLMETTPPKGFVPVSDPIDVDIELTDIKTNLPGFIGVINWEQDEVISVGNYTVYTKDDVAHLLPVETKPEEGAESEEKPEEDIAYVVIPNERGAYLPETGGIGTLPIRVAGLAVATLAGGILWSRKRRI